MQLKDIWSVRACNIPRAGDFGVPNPGESHVTVMWQSCDSHMIDLIEGLGCHTELEPRGQLCTSAMPQSFSYTETECFELSITKAQGEGGTFKSTKVSCSFHIAMCSRSAHDIAILISLFISLIISLIVSLINHLTNQLTNHFTNQPSH